MTALPPTPGLFSRDRLHVPFIALALAIAVFGGFVLGIALPLRAALGTPGAGWVAHAQVHGHLQTVGFVGLFIVGVSYRLLPAFSGGRPLAHPRLAPLSLWLIGGGVLLRAAGQPAADQPLFAALLAAGAWAELAGAACFAANVLAMTPRGIRAHEPFALFFSAGAVWFVAQAALGAWWLSDLALSGQTVLRADRSLLLVTLQFFGFHLMFILGVGIRSFPVFFAARRPSFRAVAAAFSVTQVGLVLIAVGGIAAAQRLGAAWPLENTGAALAGLGLASTTAFTGWWRSPARIRPASRPFALALQPAMAWLTLAALLLAGLAVRGLAERALPPAHQADAVRHIVALGVLLMTMVAMAQLVLPEFASERLAGRQGAWRGLVFGALLSLATVLRAGSRFFARELPADVVNWSMALAGVLALTVVIAFALLFLRSVRNHGAMLAKVAAFTAGDRALPISERAR
ncbi:MAG: hypothetical protein WEB13_09425 [Dehalococcoidia bacterium]